MLLDEAGLVRASLAVRSFGIDDAAQSRFAFGDNGCEGRVTPRSLRSFGSASRSNSMGAARIMDVL